MIAQFNLDSNYVRIFLKTDDALMDCHIPSLERTTIEADIALTRCGIKRIGKWLAREWGFEAKCSFYRKTKLSEKPRNE